jgi:hypothetical protein
MDTHHALDIEYIIREEENSCHAILAEKEADHRQALDLLEADHADDMRKVREDNEAVFDAEKAKGDLKQAQGLLATSLADLEQLKGDQATELQKLKDDHTKELQTARDNHAAQLKIAREDHAAQLKTAKAEFEAAAKEQAGQLRTSNSGLEHENAGLRATLQYKRRTNACLTTDLAWFTEQAENCTDLTIQNWRLEEKNHKLLAQIEDLQARRSPPASMTPLPLELIDDVVTLDLGEGSTQLSDIDDDFFDRNLDGDTFIGEDLFNSGLDDDDPMNDDPMDNAAVCWGLSTLSELGRHGVKTVGA